MKKALLLMTCFFILVSGLNAQTATAPAGIGAEDDPFIIETWENLYWVSQNQEQWDKHFLQTADIVFPPEITTWDGGKGWTPIGKTPRSYYILDLSEVTGGTFSFSGVYMGSPFTTSSITYNSTSNQIENALNNAGFYDCYISGSYPVFQINIYTSEPLTMNLNTENLTGGDPSNLSFFEDKEFTGIYDGNHHTVSNLHINRSEISGLFGVGKYAIVKNLTLENVNITGVSFTGGIMGFNKGTISNCHTSSGLVKGSNYGGTGGIVGGNGTIENGGIITGSSNSCDVEGSSNSMTGGIAGRNGGLIETCMVTGNITGHASYTGGLAGANGTCGLYQGGFDIFQGIIQNCYTQANITTTKTDYWTWIGGIVGANDNSKVKHCYSASTLTFDPTLTFVGGLIGSNKLGSNTPGTVESSYFTGNSAGAGTYIENPDDLKKQSTFLSWDFMGESTNGTDNLWGINNNHNNGFPFLKWQGYKMETIIDSWPTASAIIYGNTLSESTLTNGSSNVEGSFGFSGPDHKPTAGTNDFEIVFIPYDETECDRKPGFTSVEVTPKPLTITALTTEKTYGSTDPDMTVQYEGFITGEDESVLSGTLSVNRDAGENAGTYDITPSGLSSVNYSITFYKGLLTINKAMLGVRAKDASRIKGEPNPAFELVFSGFVNDEDETVIDEWPVASCIADESSAPGQYDITVSGGNDQNYGFIYEEPVGQLTVTVTSGIPENDSNSQRINVYPNPAKDFLNISGINLPQKGLLLNSAGQKIAEVPLDGQPFNLSEFAPGFYFLVINNQTIKIIKK